ncbi:hypothetical protein K450DRAFT_225992 [Umbelopsis ramanniana AG]|uniref:SET domain-containing protein n=1 Tax=Umbelopsis ramanniana AG TaxID=1314678 RepID=A0AAD5EG39_UMBRA|nr:uncharacterized protein K450DRAFT_225992 [Umbelopsis ramanniana AG]KAI8582589.1 hypothetical protein K450DRAFT_225992 [Umbelopsis ramanniana AG]
MMATVDLEPGDTLVSVPKNILITASEVAKRLNVGHQLDSNQLLVLEICRLKQQGAKSSWWPYVRLLPQDFNTMPVTYPEDVLKSALPPHLTAEIQEQKAKIDADYRHVVQYSKNTSLGVEDIDYKEFEWAWLCVNTRCIHLGMEDRSIVGGNIALAPMLDFLNHKSDAQFECGYNRKTQSFDIRTLMPYRRGQQVFFQYGAHDNAFLLKEYGFVVANNPYSAINLDDQMSKLFARLRVSGKFGAMKLKMLEENGDYTIRRNDISFRTLTALRLIMATDKVQCSAWQRCLLGSQDIISEEIEQQVGLLLGDMCANTVRRSERALEYLQNLKLQESSELMVDSFAALFLETLWKEYISIGQAAQIELIPGLLTSSNS